jgi:methionyl-tRNA synthetase
MFIHADVFARFMRDRIGSGNVIFLSGTDCYGSPILESYRKATEGNEFDGGIEDYVGYYHENQKKVLEAYEISLNLFGASALGKTGELHKEVSKEVFEKLYSKGYIKKMLSEQFYDKKFDVLLNGRQVVGKCPVQGCSSEKGYADECSLGHQYMPNELIDPISALSGETPELKEIENWYFNLENWTEKLKDYFTLLSEQGETRKYLLNTVNEFLKKPVIYVTKNQIDIFEEVRSQLPQHTVVDEGKNSIVLVFDSFEIRENARKILSRNGVKYRTGKTLVPFRISGNIEWGVPVPEVEGMKGATFWVWPESLWAPISFTKAYLEGGNNPSNRWEDWWKSKDSKVFQFIGEDNIYFYSIAESAIFMGLQENEPSIEPNEGELQLPHIIANNHLLYMDKKASSSSNIKPPMAGELLDYYTPEQLRMHFISLGLANKGASFKPKKIGSTTYYEGVDLVLKEGNLLTNVLNKLVRSCFYTAQKYYDSKIPKGTISSSILEKSKETILNFENKMHKHEFHRLGDILDDYIRIGNKNWANNIRIADKENNNELRSQLLIDSFYVIKVAITLLHSIAPKGCDKIQEYMNLNEKVWSWDYIFEDYNFFIDDVNSHCLRFLEPKEDFFTKHHTQFEMKE